VGGEVDGLAFCVVGSDRERSGRVYARITQAEPSGSSASRPVSVDATELVERFVGRYTNLATARQYRSELTALFAYAGTLHPRGTSRDSPLRATPPLYGKLQG
jgi:hypothetical protein